MHPVVNPSRPVARKHLMAVVRRESGEGAAATSSIACTAGICLTNTKRAQYISRSDVSRRVDTPTIDNKDLTSTDGACARPAAVWRVVCNDAADKVCVRGISGVGGGGEGARRGGGGGGAARDADDGRRRQADCAHDVGRERGDGVVDERGGRGGADVVEVEAVAEGGVGGD